MLGRLSWLIRNELEPLLAAEVADVRLPETTLAPGLEAAVAVEMMLLATATGDRRTCGPDRSGPATRPAPRRKRPRCTCRSPQAPDASPAPHRRSRVSRPDPDESGLSN
jgi:hypothetical protein